MRMIYNRIIISLLCLALFSQTSGFALPTGWEVIEGEATFEVQDNILNITTTTDKTIINYISFNLASGETINIFMPGIEDSVIHRVIGGDVSHIDGIINSNGRFGLINTAGIVIANSAQINAAALLASTLNLSNDDFMSDQLTFEKTGESAGIINNGVIDISNGGYAIIAASGIVNTGEIIAEDGSIHLAVGDKISVHLSDSTSVSVTVDEEVKTLIGNLNTAIQNNGRIVGHTVALKTKLSDNVIENAINNDGIIQGKALVNEGGKIFIEATGGGAVVNNTGVLYAGPTTENKKAGTIVVRGDSNYNKGTVIASGGVDESGGTIHLLGQRVVNEGSFIDASGDTGGGEILIGGDFQGKGTVENAVMNIADENTLVLADAYSSGDGGKVIFWSDENTFNETSIYARGGLTTGDGGFVEVSGKEYLDYFGHVDLTATDGEKGTLLLDPTNLNIVEWNGPTDIAGLRLWLDASDINGDGSSYTNGSSVGTWVDKSGNGFNATEGNGANQPTYVAGAINGNGGLFFNDEAQGLEGNITRPTGTASTVLTIGQYNTASGNDKAFWEVRGNGGGPRQFFIDQRYAGNYYDYNVTRDTPLALLIEDPGGTTPFDLTQNGTQIVNNGNHDFNTSFTNGNYTLGDDDTGGNRLIGYLSEILYYDRALTSDEISLLSQHTEAKWGINQGINLTNVSQLSDKYVEYLSQSSNVSLQADQNITIENMSDNLISLGNRSLTLTATNGNIVFNDINDRIRTEGTNITMNAGGSMTLGILDTRGASGTLNTGNVDLNGTGNGSINLAGANIGGTLDVTTATGGNITVNNSTVMGAVDLQNAANTNGDITGSGNTFNGTTVLDTNDVSNGNITMSANFVGDVELYGDVITVTDTAGDLTITNLTSGATTADSVINALSAGANVDISTHDIGSGGGGYLEVNANNDIAYTKLTSPWVLNERLVLNSTNGGDITINDAWTSQNITGRSAAYSVGAVGTGTFVSSNGGDLIINNLDSTAGVTVTSGFNNVYVGSSAGTAVDNVANLNITATGDIIGYGDINGTVAANGARVYMYDTAGNFNSAGITATGSSGWNGAADETLVIQAQSGDVRGAGFTTTGAGNMRLQSGSTGDLGAAYSVDVTNVSANQNASFFASGADGGVSINVAGTSSVAGNIIASGYNASNYLTGASGDINITLDSGNLTSSLIWGGNGADINLATNNGAILQSESGFNSLYGGGSFNGKTIFTESANVNLTADSGAGYIMTGVNALGAGSSLTATARGSNGSGVSIQLFGRVDGNLNAHHVSGSGIATSGHVYLGTGIGDPVDLNDVYTVMDVVGDTYVKSNGDVRLYGMFAGDTSITKSDSITILTDKLGISGSTLKSTGDINLTSLMGSVTGGLLNAGAGNVSIQAGSQSVRDKMSYVNFTNFSTTGNLNVTTYGTTTGNETGVSIDISGSVGGSVNTTTDIDGSVSTP